MYRAYFSPNLIWHYNAHLTDYSPLQQPTVSYGVYFN